MVFVKGLGEKFKELHIMYGFIDDAHRCFLCNNPRPVSPLHAELRASESELRFVSMRVIPTISHAPFR